MSSQAGSTPKVASLTKLQQKEKHQQQILASLVSNISHNTVRAEGTKLISQVFSGAEYSAYLEFGTRKMAERPFLQPALDENAPKIEADFKKGGLIK